MGYFDPWNDKEEEVTPATKPHEPKPVELKVTPDAGKEPDWRELLMQKWKSASDDSEVSKARESADSTSRNMGILTGIGQALTASSRARGGDGFNDSVLKAVAQNARQKVGDAQQARQDRMNGVLTEDKLQQQGVERERDATRFGWEKGVQDKAAKLGDKTSTYSILATKQAIPVINQKLSEARQAGAPPEDIQALESLAAEVGSGNYSAAEIGEMKLLDKADYKDILNNKAAMARQRSSDAAADRRSRDNQAAEDRRLKSLQYNQEKGLRDQIEKDPFIVGAVNTNTNLDKISDLLDRETGPADEALGMVWQKGLDPISVVRESEFARTAEGQSLLGRAEAIWGKATNGTRFTPELRQEMAAVMEQIRNGNARYIDSKLKATESSIVTNGLNRTNVIPEYIDALRAPRKKAPKQGEGQAPSAAPQGATPPSPTLTPKQKEMLDRAKAAVADPKTDPETKASAEKVIAKYGG